MNKLILENTYTPGLRSGDFIVYDAVFNKVIRKYATYKLARIVCDYLNIAAGKNEFKIVLRKEVIIL